MNVREVSVTEAGVVQTNHARAGVHLSDVIRYMTLALGKYAEKDLAEEDFHRFKVGFSWEAGVLGTGILMDTLAHHEHTIPALKAELDGIRMTSDGVDLACGRVVECKATWYSVAKSIEDPVFGHYHWQGKAYCRAFEVPKCLFVFAYMMGDYRENRRPMFKAWEVEYDAPELEQNWGMILRNRDAMLRDREKKGEK